MTNRRQCSQITYTSIAHSPFHGCWAHSKEQTCSTEVTRSTFRKTTEPLASIAQFRNTNRAYHSQNFPDGFSIVKKTQSKLKSKTQSKMKFENRPLVSNIAYLPEISGFFELLSAQVSYHGFRVPKVVPVLQTCMSILIEKKRS